MSPQSNVFIAEEDDAAATAYVDLHKTSAYSQRGRWEHLQAFISHSEHIHAEGQYLRASCTSSVMRACEMGDVFVSA